MNENYDNLLKIEQQRQITPKSAAPKQITPKNGQVNQIKINQVQIKNEEQNNIMRNRNINQGNKIESKHESSSIEIDDEHDMLSFQGRYQSNEKVGQGCFGQVCNIVDSKNSKRRLVNKIQENLFQFQTELEFLQTMSKVFVQEQEKKLGKKINDDGSLQSQELKDQLIQQQYVPLLVAHGTKSLKIWKYIDDLSNFAFQDQQNILRNSNYKIQQRVEEIEEKSNKRHIKKKVQKINEVYQLTEVQKYYIIMDKFGDSLRHVYEKFDCHFSNKTIIQIGIQIVGILEKIHKNGYIFNDLKPDNILVGNVTLNEAKKDLQKNKNNPELNQKILEEMQLYKLRFIDFGLVTRFLDEKGEHIKDGISDKFKGSMLFASKNSFKFLRTSRRDDLISLVYILIFMIDIDRLKFINEVEGIAKKEKFKIIKDQKLAMSVKDLCGKDLKESQAFHITEFVKNVMDLKFEEEPNYGKLKFFLTKALLETGDVPNKEHDWQKDFMNDLQVSNIKKRKSNQRKKKQQGALLIVKNIRENQQQNDQIKRSKGDENIIQNSSNNHSDSQLQSIIASQDKIIIRNKKNELSNNNEVQNDDENQIISSSNLRDKSSQANSIQAAIKLEQDGENGYVDEDLDDDDIISNESINCLFLGQIFIDENADQEEIDQRMKQEDIRNRISQNIDQDNGDSGLISNSLSNILKKSNQLGNNSLDQSSKNSQNANNSIKSRQGQMNNLFNFRDSNNQPHLILEDAKGEDNDQSEQKQNEKLINNKSIQGELSIMDHLNNLPQYQAPFPNNLDGDEILQNNSHSQEQIQNQNLRGAAFNNSLQNYYSVVNPFPNMQYNRSISKNSILDRNFQNGSNISLRDQSLMKNSVNLENILQNKSKTFLENKQPHLLSLQQKVYTHQFSVKSNLKFMNQHKGAVFDIPDLMNRKSCSISVQQPNSIQKNFYYNQINPQTQKVVQNNNINFFNPQFIALQQQNMQIESKIQK